MTILTEEIVEQVKQHVILTTIPDVLKRDGHLMQQIGLKMPGLFDAYFEAWTDRAFREQEKVRKFFRAHDVKILSLERTADSINVLYLYKKYQFPAYFYGAHIKSQIEMTLDKWRKEG